MSLRPGRSRPWKEITPCVPCRRTSSWHAGPLVATGKSLFNPRVRLSVLGPGGTLLRLVSRSPFLGEQQTAFYRVPDLLPQVGSSIALIGVTQGMISGSGWWISAVYAIHHLSLWPPGMRVGAGLPQYIYISFLLFCTCVMVVCR